MENEERIETTVYIRMDSRGRITGTSKGYPRLSRGEIAFRLFISIPASVFRSPIFEAEIEIEEGQVITPQVEIKVEDEGLPEQEQP